MSPNAKAILKNTIKWGLLVAGALVAGGLGFAMMSGFVGALSQGHAATLVMESMKSAGAFIAGKMALYATTGAALGTAYGAGTGYLETRQSCGSGCDPSLAGVAERIAGQSPSKARAISPSAEDYAKYYEDLGVEPKTTHAELEGLRRTELVQPPVQAAVGP